MAKKTWIHIGLGSFHRAHQARYFNELLKLGDCDWSFAAGNIRDDAEATVEGMLAQGNKYTLETVSPQGEKHFEVITSISNVYRHSKDLKELILAGANINTKVISFTVTEAGYYLNSKGDLDTDSSVIKDDLAGSLNTIYAAICAILKKRMEDGKHHGNSNEEDITLLCCDNVRENGEKFSHGFKQFLTHKNEQELLSWFNAHVATPNTMVDRITPRPEPSLKDEIEKETGFADKAPVMAETFIQWVIEDNFKAGRPELEKVGVEMVKSVLPYEDAKLRILNSTHNLLAWSGILKGHKFVYECAQDKELFKYSHDYITNCVIPCLKGSPINLESYRDVTLDRFCSPYIKDKLERICQDSFSKVYTFIQPTLFDCYRLGIDATDVVFLPALYYVFLEELYVHGLQFDYQDGTFDKAWYDEFSSASDPIQAYADTKILFGDLGKNPEFVKLLKEQIDRARAIKVQSK